MCTVFVLLPSQIVYVTGLCTDCITQLPSHLGSEHIVQKVDTSPSHYAAGHVHL